MHPTPVTTASPPTYLLHGLRVRSEVELDAPVETAGASADVEIRWGPALHVPNEAPDGSLVRFRDVAGSASWLTLTGARYTLRTGDWCEFEFDRDLRAVEVRIAPDTEPGLASVMMPNFLANLLVLGGHSVIHASAVELSGQAVAFVGDSGRGKSTVAALCCAAGARLVSDDVLRVEAGDRGLGAWCYRGSGELRLRAKAAALAHSIEGAVTRETSDGRWAVRPRATTAERLPMGAVVAPVCEHEKEELHIVRLHGLKAALELIQYPRTLGWVSQEPARRDLHVLSQLAGQVPIYKANLPWGPPFQPDLGARLLAELQRMGLGADDPVR